MDPNIAPHHLSLKDWLSPLEAFTGSRVVVDRLHSVDDIDHLDGIGGQRSGINLSTSVQLYTVGETFLVFGDLALVGVTGVHYADDGTYLGHTLRLTLHAKYTVDGTPASRQVWSRTLVTVDSINDPAIPFSPGLHRFTIGISNPLPGSKTVKISVDGETPESVEINLGSGASFGDFDHGVYSRIALLNNTVFSSVAIFFHEPYPSAAWLSTSQKALMRAYSPAISEDEITISNPPPLEGLPGSLLNSLNSILLLGTNQTQVSTVTRVNGFVTVRVEPSVPGLTNGGSVQINSNKQGPFDGFWRITALDRIDQVTASAATGTEVPATITVNSTSHAGYYRFSDSNTTIRVTTATPHRFSIGDLIALHHITDTTQPHSWVVSDIDAEGFTATLSGVSLSYSYSDNCIAKNAPVGGGCWSKVFSENSVGWSYQSIEAQPKNILIDDTAWRFSSVTLADTDNSNPSSALYIPKDIKSTFNLDRGRSPAKAFGDCHRVYLFLPAKQNNLTHTSVIVFGEIYDWFNSEWCVVGIVSASDEVDQNTGFNCAFQFPSWSIDKNTGYLICRSFESHLSDGRIKASETLLGFGDSGQHVYPINLPFISFVP